MKNEKITDIMQILQEKGLNINKGFSEKEEKFNNSKEESKTTLMKNYYNKYGFTIEEYDKAKTRVLKYVTYKKRTENEVKIKFSQEINYNILDQVIEELKDLGYISDTSYIERAVNEFIAIKNLSLKEIKYKLLSKGIKKDIIEDYFADNYDELLDYEIKSCQNIYSKKIRTMEDIDVKTFLRKKGYREESIKAIK